VRPSGERYLLVYGMRRLKAAIRAGLEEVPCTIQVADDDRTFLLNTIENLHRRQLSAPSALPPSSVSQLAATDLGVRELGRRTGFAHTTIARWLKIERRPVLKEAVEQERLDIGRAMVLASAPDGVAERLLLRAASISQADLWKAVAEAREEVVHNAPASAFVDDDKRLADVEAKLARVRVISPVGLAHLERIRDQVLALLSQAGTERLPVSAVTSSKSPLYLQRSVVTAVAGTPERQLAARAAYNAAVQQPLASQTCVPCHEGTAPLTLEQAQVLLADLDGRWQLAQGGRTLTYHITFKNFARGMAFLNRLAEIASVRATTPTSV
jgi:ParB-like chromosome segregation protein Spo0J